MTDGKRLEPEDSVDLSLLRYLHVMADTARPEGARLAYRRYILHEQQRLGIGACGPGRVERKDSGVFRGTAGAA